tara:strand:- start:519 stop:827 length:309 start_codon:yes stop_codon:yes gene_type:complete
VNKVSEDIHYSLVPIDDESNKQAWAIRLLEGPHPETVIRLGNIAFDPDGDCLTFNFSIQSSPDGDLDESDPDLQEFVADVLEDVLEKGINDGTITSKEKDED